MGYHTDFNGEFKCDPVLHWAHRVYLEKFAETRRMKRDPKITETLTDPIREEIGLPVGEEGEFYVNGSGFRGQGDDSSVLNHNGPPRTQPGLWCQWVPNEDGTAIVWDLGEKFYHHVEWLQYLIDNFFERYGYTLNGEVRWQGESPDDRGIIYCKDNKIQAISDEMNSPSPDWD
jgi:hypothetical protein